jgi:hypothetical protein
MGDELGRKIRPVIGFLVHQEERIRNSRQIFEVIRGDSVIFRRIHEPSSKKSLFDEFP